MFWERFSAILLRCVAAALPSRECEFARLHIRVDSEVAVARSVILRSHSKSVGGGGKCAVAVRGSLGGGREREGGRAEGPRNGKGEREAIM